MHSRLEKFSTTREKSTTEFPSEPEGGNSNKNLAKILKESISKSLDTDFR